MDPSERTEQVAAPAPADPAQRPALSAASLQIALDASCAALLALEQARAALSDAPRELWRTQRAEAQAIELVHLAITDLRRCAASGEAEPLALGFVHAGATAARESAREAS